MPQMYENFGMARLHSLMAILLALLLVSCNPASYSGTGSGNSAPGATLVRFETGNSLADVMDKAERADKLVFIDFYASWCAPCKLMERDVYTHRETAELLNQHFVNYKVNVERNNGPDLAVLYGVHVYPTLLFLDQEGQVLARKDGAAYQREIQSLARQAIRDQQKVSVRD